MVAHDEASALLSVWRNHRVGRAVGNGMEIAAKGKGFGGVIAEANDRPRGFRAQRNGRIRYAIGKRLHVRFQKLDTRTDDQPPEWREVQAQPQIADPIAPNHIRGGARGRRSVEETVEISHGIAGETRITVVEIRGEPMVKAVGKTLVDYVIGLCYGRPRALGYHIRGQHSRCFGSTSISYLREC